MKAIEATAGEGHALEAKVLEATLCGSWAARRELEENLFEVKA